MKCMIAGLGTVQMIVGVQKNSNNKVQYSITAIK